MCQLMCEPFLECLGLGLLIVRATVCVAAASNDWYVRTLHRQDDAGKCGKLRRTQTLPTTSHLSGMQTGLAGASWRSTGDRLCSMDSGLLVTLCVCLYGCALCRCWRPCGHRRAVSLWFKGLVCALMQVGEILRTAAGRCVCELMCVRIYVWKTVRAGEFREVKRMRGLADRPAPPTRPDGGAECGGGRGGRRGAQSATWPEQQPSYGGGRCVCV